MAEQNDTYVNCKRVKIRHRYDTVDRWEEINPKLLRGEIGNLQMLKK